MSTYELPLVLFTVLGQLSIGLVCIAALCRAAAPAGVPQSLFREWSVAGVVLGAGIVASIFHLGHPGGMIRTLANLETAWLSREALTLGIFVALLVIGLVMMRQDKESRALVAATCVAGLAVIFSMGMTYSPPSFPAVNNILPFVFFMITAALLGSGAAAAFAPEHARPLVLRILDTSLIIGLVIYLAVPCIWLSGGEIMKQTGQLWLSSPLFWGRIGIGLALPLVVLWTMKKVPVWLWGLILAGELMGRALFFAGTVHTATNMGGLY